MKSSIVVAKPGKKIRLRDIDPDDTGDYAAKEDSLEPLGKLHQKLETLQQALYAEHKHSLLIVLQAMDTGGKDGATKSLMLGVNPTGVNITSFKAPTAAELDHDFLWRVHQHVPGKGVIGIWNRSHYEDVLIVRVHKLIEKKAWQRRYEDINNFEQMLMDNGVTILKFFLHISKDEQKKRLQARLEDPEKIWKFNLGDLDERKLWDDYQEAYEDAINNCSTKHAPWRIVPANHKWSRNSALAAAVVETLEEMKPKYPKPTFDLKKVVID
ncbi:MAG: polyphosphate kinase 2 family protein [Abitibacteriaceae bacterium]|nr:polyphosphate kinase 2 family protein [Abditibacteriaceae bacterium]